MLSKIYLLIFTTLILIFSIFYFTYNSSYKSSLEARVYYMLGNYKEAYSLAKDAYELDNYNKMAFTVMTQSNIAQSYERYIEQGNAYLTKIDDISSKKEYTKQDKLRVKLMCEIMINSYEQLVPTKLTEIQLQDKSKKIYEKFQQLYKELF